MRISLLALALAAACPAVHADDTPQPQPLAPGGAIAAAKARALPLTTVVASPVVMATSAVRSADGSIAMVCEQKPNPHPQPIVNRPAPEPQQ